MMLPNPHPHPTPHPSSCPPRSPLQVATDTRLWLYGQVQMIRGALRELIAAAADRAEAEVDVLLPGFTHLQPAQVRKRCVCWLPCGRSIKGHTLSWLPHLACPQTVRWSHWLLSHAAAWQRDDERLRDLLPRLGTLPLGSGEAGAAVAMHLRIAT